MSGMGWMAAADLSAKAVDQWIAYSSAHEANRTNIRLAKENREWMEKMSNTAIQRSAADMKAAGLNPIMSIAQPSVTPQPAPARVEPAYKGGFRADAVSSAAALASARVSDAQARKLNAEAELVEANIPYSALNARSSADKLFKEAERLGADVANLRIDNMSREQWLKHEAVLLPLVEQYQKIVNDAARLGIPEKKALADFWETVPQAKWMQILKSMVPALLIRGGNTYNPTTVIPRGPRR